MTRSLLLPAACALLLAALLAACGHAAPDDDEAAAPPGQVAVTTATPTRQTFHDTVEAWGSVAGDPQRARAISLGHGGQVSALLVAAGQTVKRGHPLFGPACDLIRAQALVRIHCEPPLPSGLLALGQRAELSLDARHGSELLMFLGRSLAAMIRKWLIIPHN